MSDNFEVYSTVYKINAHLTRSDKMGLIASQILTAISKLDIFSQHVHDNCYV